MKYRVRLDLAFDSESDARALMDIARSQSAKALSMSEGSAHGEISFCELELCRHDEGLPCAVVERVEVTKR